MKSEQLSEVIACLPNGRTHYRYFKGAYAPQLLSMLIDKEAPLRALKTSRLKPLVDHPLVKPVAALSGNGKLHKRDLDAVWQEPSQPFLLSISRWGGWNHWRWDQTSRQGENLVLQLNLPLEHLTLFRKWIDMSGKDTINGPYSAHPVQKPNRNERYRDTLAWARIDIDFERDEALIEEIQSDGVRYISAMAKRLRACGCRQCKQKFTYIQWFNKYSELWAEAMMMATLWFTKQELGINRIYYHTARSGWQIKHMHKKWQAPTSLYSSLPKKFAFKQTWAAPEFLLDTRAYQQLIRRQPDIDFYLLNMQELKPKLRPERIKREHHATPNS